MRARGAIGRSTVTGINTLPLLRGQEKARRVRRGAGIAAYVGANGSGKSLLAAHDTIPTLRGIPWSCDNPDHWHTAEGVTSGLRKVVSTMRFVLPDGRDHPLWVPLDSYKKIIRAEHCDLILDEVGGAAASATSDSLPQPVKTSLQELRRRDVLCRHTAPSWARATKVLRECSQTVTLVMGFMPVPVKAGVQFPGPHPVEGLDDDGDLVEVMCEQVGEHSHDSGRLWGARRLHYARTFDANRFEEWTAEKREKIRPMVRSLYWRPGGEAESAYDTNAYVYKLGQVTDAGDCVDCGGRRAARKCECESPTTRRARSLATAGASIPRQRGREAAPLR